MAMEPIRAVNYIPGKFYQPIKLEILATSPAVDVYSLAVMGFMRKVANFVFYSLPVPLDLCY